MPGLRKQSKSRNSGRSAIQKPTEQLDIYRTKSYSSVARLRELGKELRQRYLHYNSSPC
jgi:hypothetical protein